MRKLIFLTALLFLVNLYADSNTNKVLIYESDFNTDNFGKETGFKGNWRPLGKKVKNGNKVHIENGALFLFHPKENKHPLGVFWSLEKGLCLTDVEVSAKFKIKENEELTLSFTGQNFSENNNRIFLLNINKDGCNFADASVKGTRNSKKIEATISSDKWHNIRFVIQGEKCTVYLNDLPAATLESKGMACKKQTFKLGTKTSFLIDDLKIMSLAGEPAVLPNEKK